MPENAAWKMVTCRSCGKKWRCTPQQDYYNATTLTDGLCWDCLLKEDDLPAQPEPSPLVGPPHLRIPRR
jgi:hypothetical protein